jgi:excisionase family DNA binding protein
MRVRGVSERDPWRRSRGVLYSRCVLFPTDREEPMDRPMTISVEEAGKLLGVSRARAYQSAREGSIPTIRHGRRVAVPVHRLAAECLGCEAADIWAALDSGKVAA